MKMGDDYQQKMIDALVSARASKSIALTGKTLHIKSGQPVNIFDPPAWAAAFTEFLYGDCAPNLGRPAPTSLRLQLYYLTMREELEYSLDTDKDDPLIAGDCYKAPAQSRWNTPDFIAIFADVVTCGKAMVASGVGIYKPYAKPQCRSSKSYLP